MTKVACMIILQVGTIRHLWKSIKTLRKKNTSEVSEPNESNNTADSVFIDNDILEVWSLLGLHALFTYTKIENVLQYIPFYYYLKMIGLSIFFFIPSATNKNVPAQFLFDKVLVRGVDKIHWFLTYYDEYSDWCKRQFYSLPWRVVDLIFPGLLQYSTSIDWRECQESRLLCWHLRKKQLQKCKEKNPYQPCNMTHTVSSSPILIDEQDKTISKTEISDTFVPNSPDSNSQGNRKLTRGQTNKSVSPKTKSTSKSHAKRKSMKSSMKSSIDRSSSSIFSPVAQSRIHASSVQLQNFSRSHKKINEKNRKKRLSFPLKLSSPIIRDTKKSRARVLHLNENKSGSQGSQTPKTPSSSLSKVNSRFRRNSPQKETKSPSLSKSSFGTDNILENSETKTPSPSENLVTESKTDSIPSPSITRFKSLLSRKSIGSALRQVVTGNAHIRLRDFLFDLDLPNTSVSYMHSNPHELSRNSNLKNNHNDIDDNKNLQDIHTVPPENEIVKKRRKRRSTGDILHRRSNQVHNSNVTPRISRRGKKIKETVVNKIDFDKEVSSSLKSPTSVKNVREKKTSSIKKKIISSSTSTLRKITRKSSSQSDLSSGSLTSRNIGKDASSKNSSISSKGKMKKTKGNDDKSTKKEQQSFEMNDVSAKNKISFSPGKELNLKHSDIDHKGVTDKNAIDSKKKKESKSRQRRNMTISSSTVRRSKRLASK